VICLRFLSGRLCTVRQAGLAGCEGPSSSIAGGGGGSSGIGGCSCFPMFESNTKPPPKKKLESSYLGCPIRSEFTSSTVFRLESHQFSNLTKERGRQIPSKRSPDVFCLLLECPSLVPELSNLVQKDPDLASKSFGEIIDISAFDGSAGRGN